MEILRYAAVFPFSEVIRPIRIIESQTGFYMRTASVMKGLRLLKILFSLGEIYGLLLLNS